MKRVYLLFLFALATGIMLRAQVATQNYVRTRIMTTNLGTSGNCLDRVDYYDGLGRPFQSLQKKVTTSRNLVSYQEYDAQGRDSSSWLAYPVADDTEYVRENDYRTGAKGYYNDLRPFSESAYENSPLNRVVRQQGPGNAWNSTIVNIPSKALYTEYHTNTGSGVLSCLKYTITATSVGSSTWAAGQLYVVKQTGEDNEQTYTFTDKMGRTILSRSVVSSTNYDTYYVYDNAGNLAYVLTPEFHIASNKVAALPLHAYQYKYNSKNLLTEKKLPGCDPVYYKYDKAERMVFSQDGNQRVKGEWTYYFYDKFGRPQVTGTCTGSPGSFEGQVLTATFNSAGGPQGSNYTLPTLSGVTYKDYTHSWFYDNSSFPTGELSYTSESGYGTKYTNATGLLTGEKVKALSGTGDYLTSYHYDNRNRLIQKKSSNHVGGYDKEYYAYTFTGEPSQYKKLHTSTKSPTQTQEVYSYTYDHAMRLISVSHQLNNNAAVILAQHTYDDLGRLRTKMNHSATVNTATYAYNLRSWLTDINGSKFTQNLYYNTGSGTARYNGNISSMLWKSGSETVTRGYKFTYDDLNRLTAAVYGEGTALSTNADRFSEKGIMYDYNGNIRKLERRGKSSASAYGIIDNLTLGYNGNQLTNVTDAATDPTFEGNFNFVDGSKITGTEYIYDKNGNMVQDFNKKIANISYNFLNLPGKLQFGYGHMAEYLYDGAGVKRQMISTTVNQNLSVANGSFKEPTAAQKASVKTTDYVGNIIYENGTLSMILTGEGYLTLSGTTPTYHYYLKDHQGNNRVVVNQSGTVTQVNHYYPFGGVFGGEGVDTAKQPFKYNDKEFDRTNGLDLYDYSARFMDAALGRFTTVDPLVETKPWNSPYSYCSNNPVNRIDPDGRDDYRLDREGRLHFLELTNAKSHTIYATNNKGMKDNTSIDVDKSFVDNRKSDVNIKAQDSDGNINSYSVDIYTTNSDKKGTAFFEFAANNTDVEWSHIKTTQNGMETNYVSTSHDEVDASQDYLIQKTFNANDAMGRVAINIREANHSHPNGSIIVSGGDVEVAKRLQGRFPNAKMHNYTTWAGYTPFNRKSTPAELPAIEIVAPRIKK